MMKEKYAKKSGFSYLELICSLFLFFSTLIFVQQLLFNVKKVEYLNKSNNTLIYETVALRIESHFKEVNTYNIEEHKLSYQYRDCLYNYLILNNTLYVRINSIYYPLINNIKEVIFQKGNHFLYITFIDLAENHFTVRAIIYEK